MSDQEQFLEALSDEIMVLLGVDQYTLDNNGFTKKAVACPMVRHEHDDTNPAAHWHVEKHFLRCFKCDKDYKAVDVAAALNIDVSKYRDNGSYSIISNNSNGTHGLQRVQIETTKREYAGLEEYAIAHGATLADYEAAKWSETQHNGRAALAFPTPTGTRYRYLDDASPTYAHDKGTTATLYGFERAVKMGQDYIVLCNGEASTVAAQAAGIPAFCKTSGEGKLSDEMMQRIEQEFNGIVWIALDCDNTGREKAQQVGLQFGDKARVIDLGLSDGGDLADFVKLHKDQSMAQLARLERKKAERPLENAVKDLAQAMKQIHRANESGVTDEKLQSMMQQARKLADEIEGHAAKVEVVSGEEVVNSSFDRVKELAELKGRFAGLTTYKPLDELTGSFVGGGVYTILAQTGGGKSTLAASLAPHLMRQASGLIISTEMSPRDWLMKIACSIAKVPIHYVIRGTMNPTQYQRLQNAYNGLKAGAGIVKPFSFVNATNPNMAQIKANVKDSFAQNRIRWIILDSISNAGERSDQIFNDTRAVSKALIDLVVPYDVALIQTVQIGRNTKNRQNKEPLVNDAKGAGDIEEDSQVMISLYNHDKLVRLGEADPNESKYPKGTVRLGILKNRFFPTEGEYINLDFLGGAGMYPRNTLKPENVKAPAAPVIEDKPVQETDIPF